MVINNTKYAYTLLEACVVMLIVSIFIAVAANVIPHKVKSKTEADVHGRYECYYSNGKLYEQTFVKGNPSTKTEAAVCKFTPPKYAKYLIINAVGGASASGGNAGEFKSTFYSSSDKNFSFDIGAAGSGSSNGGDTVVYACNNSTCTDRQEVLKAKGGEYTSGTNGHLNTTIDDVLTCTAQIGEQVSSSSALSKDFTCDKSPVCEIENNMIKVSYCRTNEIYKTDYIPYKRTSSYSSESNMPDTKFIVNSPYPKTGKWDKNTGTLVYYDASLWDNYGIEPPDTWDPASDNKTPSLYKLTLKLKVNNAATSLMENYIKMLQLSSDISTVKPGSVDGGTSNSGAVLILW